MFKEIKRKYRLIQICSMVAKVYGISVVCGGVSREVWAYELQGYMSLVNPDNVVAEFAGVFLPKRICFGLPAGEVLELTLKCGCSF